MIRLFSPIKLTSHSFSSQSLGQCKKTQISALSNGFRIASHPLGGETATVGIWIDAGSRFENDRTNGVAHFLEHLSFKGTPKRSKTQLEMEFEAMGGHLNAYTSREQTVYWAQVFGKDVPKAVGILADILQNSKLEPAAIESERGVILREMEEVNKQMEEVVFDHLHAVAFQGTSLGKTILGPRENILSLKRPQFLDYVKQNYTGRRMVLVGAGAVEHAQLEELANKHFSSLPATAPGSAEAFRAEPAKYTGSDVLMRDDTMENAHVAIAVEGASWTSPNYWPLLIAQSVIGSWDKSLAGGSLMASKLAQTCSQKAYAQSFMSFNTSYSDTGLFGIYFVSARRWGLDELVREIQQEWTRLCLGLGEAECTRAKNQLKTNLLLSLDGTVAVAEDIGRQVLTLGKRVDLEQLFAYIDSIDAKTIRNVTSDYLYDRCPVVAAFGPIETLPDYNSIRAANTWLRN